MPHVARRETAPRPPGFVPKPGDVAVDGLDRAGGTAEHVAVVVAFAPGERGPDVVNEDGSRTGFGVVERGRDELKAALHGPGGPLAGHVTPIGPAATGARSR